MSSYPDLDASTADSLRTYMPRIIGALLSIGVLLVAASCPLGLACVQECSPSGTCHWSPEDAERAAQVIRCLGGMAFAAGLAERLILGLSKQGEILLPATAQNELEEKT